MLISALLKAWIEPELVRDLEFRIRLLSAWRKPRLVSELVLVRLRLDLA